MCRTRGAARAIRISAPVDPEVEQLARSRGCEIAAVFEEGASAVEKRSDYDRIMKDKDAKKAPSTCSSCGRSTASAASMIGNLTDVLELDRIGVRVVSVRESWLDTSGPVTNSRGCPSGARFRSELDGSASVSTGARRTWWRHRSPSISGRWVSSPTAAVRGASGRVFKRCFDDRRRRGEHTATIKPRARRFLARAAGMRRDRDGTGALVRGPTGGAPAHARADRAREKQRRRGSPRRRASTPSRDGSAPSRAGRASA